MVFHKNHLREGFQGSETDETDELLLQRSDVKGVGTKKGYAKKQK